MSLLFWLHNTPNESCKIIYKLYFKFVAFSYIEKFTNEERQNDMTYDGAQDVDLDFGFNFSLVLKWPANNLTQKPVKRIN